MYLRTVPLKDGKLGDLSTELSSHTGCELVSWALTPLYLSGNSYLHKLNRL